MSVNNINSANSPSVAQSPPSLMVFFLSENRNSLATPFELFVGSSSFFQWFCVFFSTEFMLQLPRTTSSFIIDCCHQLLTHLLHSFKIGFIIFDQPIQVVVLYKSWKWGPKPNRFMNDRKDGLWKGFSDECHCRTVNVYRHTLPAVLANHVMDTRSVQDHHHGTNS